MWSRKDQQAWTALQAEQPARAAALARDPEIAGEGWYRAGDYDTASETWSALDSANAHYNRGNALALQGNFDGAIAAYDSALEIDSDMEDAIYNKNVIEQLRQQQQQQQQQDQQGQGDSQQKSDQDQESQSSEQSESEQEQQQSEGEQEQESSEEREQQEAEAERLQREMQEAWSEEDAQAMEQWLRRIPDDPGGLLRRKFRNEYIRRGEKEPERESW
jgi:Ca-activated chloride channel family protein